MSEKSTRDDAETFDVVVTRVLGTPVEEAWKVWSDPAYVTRWWGPTGFTSPSAEMDFRVGGASLVCMRAPAEYGGQDMYHTWTYTTIEPHERIGFVSNSPTKTGRISTLQRSAFPRGYRTTFRTRSPSRPRTSGRR